MTCKRASVQSMFRHYGQSRCRTGVEDTQVYIARSKRGYCPFPPPGGKQNQMGTLRWFGLTTAAKVPWVAPISIELRWRLAPIRIRDTHSQRKIGGKQFPERDEYLVVLPPSRPRSVCRPQVHRWTYK